MEEPCGIALIGACLPRRVAEWERTQGAVVEATQGFTLLEIAIVLTVIGLLVGGILWGAEMIGQAATRAQISQVEKFNTAATTFYVKYGYLPGDIPDPYASRFGLRARGLWAGEGDGNGIIEGNCGCSTCNGSFCQKVGEASVFWQDLASTNLIGGSFNSAVENNGWGGFTTTTSTPNISNFLPSAMIGQNTNVYVTSFNSVNSFVLSEVSELDNSGFLYSSTGITPSQAYSIDKKIDDGLPQSGRITAQYSNFTLNNYYPVWAAGGGLAGASPGTAASGSATTCFDNGGNSSATMQYSTEINNGSNPNCALSFQMQGAAR